MHERHSLTCYFDFFCQFNKTFKHLKPKQICNCNFAKSQPKLLIFMVKGKSSDTKFKYLLDVVIILLIHVTFSEIIKFFLYQAVPAVVSSAYCDKRNFVVFSVITFMPGLCFNINDKTSAQIINKYGDKGSPCLQPRCI